MKFSAALFLVLITLGCPAPAADLPVTFHARTAASGRWSDPQTWLDQRAPRAGDFVQIRAGHQVEYDVDSSEALRMVHVAGHLNFARTRDTRLEVGLLKIAPGEETSEDGFDCHDVPEAETAVRAKGEATLQIGTASEPIEPGVTALIRLAHFAGTDRDSLPAIVNCGGRWEAHGAPLNRTWVKLGAAAKTGDATVTLAEPVQGWRAGDRVIVTGSKHVYDGGASRRKGKRTGTEERRIASIDGAVLTLDQPLENEHFGTGDYRSEVANLSRNVIIESADPDGIRGHTMYHRDSTGGISYVEFRHLGKEGVLGRYALHFHLVRETMRGSGVVGASIWDSHNRWLTVHGTDYLLVRDCIGYRSVGHGFFLEDGTEQYNVFDRNLAVQAYRGKRLPKQILPFDANDGAGFWWANGRNTFVRNVACENDQYGFRFELAKTSNFNPILNLRTPDGQREMRDVRTIPFLRFEQNESHTEGLYSFNFGDDKNPSVRGDRQHPFIARNLKAWQTHYTIRPNLQYFLLEGLRVKDAAYGVYHPDYDAHVYRDIHLDHVNSEPINRGNDDDSIQYGSFTYDRLTIENSRIGRDPLIQLACTSPRTDATGHFRNLVVKNSASRHGKVVDLGGGPRNEKLEHPVSYFFHGYTGPESVLRVLSSHFPAQLDPASAEVPGFTGKDVRAVEAGQIPFPELLAPIDDLAPATLITSVRPDGGQLVVRGVSHDNGEITSIRVNGTEARFLGTEAGVVDWEVRLDGNAAIPIIAVASDKAGNLEKTPAQFFRPETAEPKRTVAVAR